MVFPLGTGCPDEAADNPRGSDVQANLPFFTGSVVMNPVCVSAPSEPDARRYDLEPPPE
jgi:hypothetical protein